MSGGRSRARILGFFHAKFPIVFLKESVFLSETVSTEQRFRVRTAFLLLF